MFDAIGFFVHVDTYILVQLDFFVHFDTYILMQLDFLFMLIPYV